MPYAVCPGCDENVYVSGTPRKGQKVYCNECESDLVVVDTDPLELDWPYEDEDDEDYEDEDDD